MGTLPRRSAALLLLALPRMPGNQLDEGSSFLICKSALLHFLALTFYGGVCATLPRTLRAPSPSTAISPVDLVQRPGWAMACRPPSHQYAGLSGTGLVPPFRGATCSRVPPQGRGASCCHPTTSDAWQSDGALEMLTLLQTSLRPALA